MRKNLLVYIEDPRFGGPHQYTINILDRLKRNFNVKLITSNHENKIFLNKVNLKNIKLKFYTFILSFKYQIFFIHFFIYKFLIIEVLKKDKIDIIIPYQDYIIKINFKHFILK